MVRNLCGCLEGAAILQIKNQHHLVPLLAPHANPAGSALALRHIIEVHLNLEGLPHALLHDFTRVIPPFTGAAVAFKDIRQLAVF